MNILGGRFKKLIFVAHKLIKPLFHQLVSQKT